MEPPGKKRKRNTCDGATPPKERGVMVYPMPGTIDGIFGDHIVLAPPFTASASDIDAIVSAVTDAIPSAIAGIPN